MNINDVEISIYSKRLNPEDGLLLEIRNGKAKYYDLDCKEVKEAEVSEKEIKSFIFAAESCGFFKLENNDKPYGINMDIKEIENPDDYDSIVNIPRSEYCFIKTNDKDKDKIVIALFCGSFTPGPYNTIIWEALRFNQTKAGHRLI